MNFFMLYLRSGLYGFLFCLWTFLLFLPMTALLLMPRLWMVKARRLWVTGVVLLLKIACNLKLEIRGKENLPREGSYIIACKHESAIETFALPMLLKNPSIVLKKELCKIPFFGWFVRYGGAIVIDRSAGMSALRSMIDQAKERLNEERPIVIFPEGTRCAYDQRVKLHRGVAALSQGTGLTTIPATLNSGLFSARGSFLKLPGTIVIEFLPALPRELKGRDYMKQLEKVIWHGAERLKQESLSQNPDLRFYLENRKQKL